MAESVVVTIAGMPSLEVSQTRWQTIAPSEVPQQRQRTKRPEPTRPVPDRERAGQLPETDKGHDPAIEPVFHEHRELGFEDEPSASRTA